MFIDEVVIRIQAGRGGDGVIHFRREKYVPFGGPDGGDGGKGGDVIVEVNPKLNTLYSLKQRTHYEAKNGASGRKQNMTGKMGDDLVLQVPSGTIIYDNQSSRILGDLITQGQRMIVAKGGRGGKGNSHYANSRNQAPRIAERGEPTQPMELRLELKLIADIGIIGLPNVGKSTFLSVVTNAKPKIADYPFTTLEPNLGVAVVDNDTTVVLADIPGLIEGSHQGAGLGIAFLKHIQRTRVLIHLLDGLSDDPVSDYSQINSELALYDANLTKKPQIVVLNKIDLPDVREKSQKIIDDLHDIIGLKDVIRISAVTGENVREVLYRAVQALRAIPEEMFEQELPVYSAAPDIREFIISQTEEGWRVEGVAIERAAEMTYWGYYQSIRRFQKILNKLGIEKALREAGVKEGDTVFIGDYELEWAD